MICECLGVETVFALWVGMGGELLGGIDAVLAVCGL